MISAVRVFDEECTLRFRFLKTTSSTDAGICDVMPAPGAQCEVVCD